ncbi:hypothetical protein AUJ14_05045 [Candidatus Micrarchaeota archaeon CG1_02_55_22]|nr:MAG: hypothetical protein AUJ14_05045 [Candidatus Micrarchaeota archaeon CG1_02_55_22]
MQPPHETLKPIVPADMNISFKVRPREGKPVVVEFASSSTDSLHRFNAHQAINTALKAAGLAHRVVRPLAASKGFNGVFVVEAAPEDYVHGPLAARNPDVMVALDAEMANIARAVKEHAGKHFKDLDAGHQGSREDPKYYSNVFVHPDFPRVNKLVLIDQGHAPGK